MTEPREPTLKQWKRRATEKRIREVFNKIEQLPDGVHVMAI